MDSALQYFKLEPATTTTIILTIVGLIVIIVFFFIILGYLKKVFYSKREEELAFIEQTLKANKLPESDVHRFISKLREKKVDSPLELYNNPAKLKEFILQNVAENMTKMNISPNKEIITSLYKVLNVAFIPYKGKTILRNTYSLKPGQNIVIEYKKKFFRSKILDCTDSYLLIQRTALDERPNQLFINEDINIYFYIPDDAGYMFSTTIKRDIQNPKIEAFMVSHSEKVYRIQKRKFLRKECNVTAVMNILNYDENLKKFSRTNIIISCIILNLSIGGALIKIPDLANFIDIYPGNYFLLECSFEEGKARVLSTTISIDNEKEIVHVSFLKFLDLSYIYINNFIFLSEWASVDREKIVSSG